MAPPALREVDRALVEGLTAALGAQPQVTVKDGVLVGVTLPAGRATALELG